MIAAVEALKYDFYKGPQYYRKCDHQSVQSVLIIESKSRTLHKDDADVFDDHRDRRARTRPTCAPARSSATRPEADRRRVPLAGARRIWRDAWPV